MEVLGDARFVGGVVRNALLGRPVTDIDIATPLPPDKVKALLEVAGIKAVPTGIDHGTITAVVDGKPFEVTTLRRDVATDGRHAIVAFTTDWAEDARRRDFTMNALYADIDGAITDVVGGIADIEAGRVRFVGDPITRIREDYLRILRFFRFHAWYGRTELDAEALYACEKEKSGLVRLSGERIAKEMLKLFEAESPVTVLMSMGVIGVLEEVVPGAAEILPLRRLAAMDAELGTAPDGVLRLAALLPAGRAVLTAQLIAARWKLSNVDRDRLVAAASAPRDIALYADPRLARRLLYRMGPEGFRDALLLAIVSETRDEWRRIYDGVRSLTAPRFPISGKDVVARGIRIGPLIGQILHTLETWWVENDFPQDALLIQRLDETVKQVQE
ncbi:CCA tRNA nucleotidyltransferase [Rhizomicrobium palustre]